MQSGGGRGRERSRFEKDEYIHPARHTDRQTVRQHVSMSENVTHAAHARDRELRRKRMEYENQPAAALFLPSKISGHGNDRIGRVVPRAVYFVQ